MSDCDIDKAANYDDEAHFEFLKDRVDELEARNKELQQQLELAKSENERLRNIIDGRDENGNLLPPNPFNQRN